MGVHRASGATHPESHLGPPQAGPPKEQESSLAAQVACLGAALTWGRTTARPAPTQRRKSIGQMGQY